MSYNSVYLTVRIILYSSDRIRQVDKNYMEEQQTLIEAERNLESDYINKS